MSISSKGEYAVRALLDLALVYYDRTPMKAVDIASKEGISKKYLEQILTAFRHSGLVNTKSGQNGGYYLAKNPRDISIAAALRIVEGPLAPVRCVSVTAYEKCTCRIEDTCALRTVWQEARDAMVGVLESTTLEDLVQRHKKLAAGSAPMYFI